MFLSEQLIFWRAHRVPLTLSHSLHAGWHSLRCSHEPSHTAPGLLYPGSICLHAPSSFLALELEGLHWPCPIPWSQLALDLCFSAYTYPQLTEPIGVMNKVHSTPDQLQQMMLVKISPRQDIWWIALTLWEQYPIASLFNLLTSNDYKLMGSGVREWKELGFKITQLCHQNVPWCLRDVIHIPATRIS